MSTNVPAPTATRSLGTVMSAAVVALFGIALLGEDSLNSAPYPGGGYWEQNTNSGPAHPILKEIEHRGRLRMLLGHAFPTHDPIRDLATLSRAQKAELAAQIGEAHGVPGHIFAALVMTESGFDPGARSHVGAIGFAQLMPATARELGVDPHDPWQNLAGGARYLRQQFERFGDWKLALAAYNAGPTRVARLGRIPRIRETQDYVQKVLRRAEGFRGVV